MEYHTTEYMNPFVIPFNGRNPRQPQTRLPGSHPPPKLLVRPETDKEAARKKMSRDADERAEELARKTQAAADSRQAEAARILQEQGKATAKSIADAANKTAREAARAKAASDRTAADEARLADEKAEEERRRQEHERRIQEQKDADAREFKEEEDRLMEDERQRLAEEEVQKRYTEQKMLEVKAETEELERLQKEGADASEKAKVELQHHIGKKLSMYNNQHDRIRENDKTVNSHNDSSKNLKTELEYTTKEVAECVQDYVNRYGESAITLWWAEKVREMLEKNEQEQMMVNIVQNGKSAKMQKTLDKQKTAMRLERKNQILRTQVMVNDLIRKAAAKKSSASLQSPEIAAQENAMIACANLSNREILEMKMDSLCTHYCPIVNAIHGSPFHNYSDFYDYRMSFLTSGLASDYEHLLKTGGIKAMREYVKQKAVASAKAVASGAKSVAKHTVVGASKLATHTGNAARAVKAAANDAHAAVKGWTKEGEEKANASKQAAETPTDAVGVHMNPYIV